MFWKNFYNLCQKANKSPNAVAKELGISSGAVTSWKNGKTPHHGTLIKIAQFFEVSTDFLLGVTPSAAQSATVPGASAQPALPTAPYDADALNNMTSPKSNVIFLPNDNIYMLPLFESVSAGFGAYPDDKIVGYQPCRMESKADAAESICIRVSGDSMFPKIEDGDIIQVHKQESVDSGRIAVVLIDGEDAVVKKVVYAAKWIELQSFNPMYPPRRFDGDDVLRVRVLGLVRSIIKMV